MCDQVSVWLLVIARARSRLTLGLRRENKEMKRRRLGLRRRENDSKRRRLGLGRRQKDSRQEATGEEGQG